MGQSISKKLSLKVFIFRLQLELKCEIELGIHINGVKLQYIQPHFCNTLSEYNVTRE